MNYFIMFPDLHYNFPAACLFFECTVSQMCYFQKIQAKKKAPTQNLPKQIIFHLLCERSKNPSPENHPALDFTLPYFSFALCNLNIHVSLMAADFEQIFLCQLKKTHRKTPNQTVDRKCSFCK